jgi:hypothetical protein
MPTSNESVKMPVRRAAQAGLLSRCRLDRADLRQDVSVVPSNSQTGRVSISSSSSSSGRSLLWHSGSKSFGASSQVTSIWRREQISGGTLETGSLRATALTCAAHQRVTNAGIGNLFALPSPAAVSAAGLGQCCFSRVPSKGSLELIGVDAHRHRSDGLAGRRVLDREAT